MRLIHFKAGASNVCNNNQLQYICFQICFQNRCVFYDCYFVENLLIVNECFYYWATTVQMSTSLFKVRLVSMQKIQM